MIGEHGNQAAGDLVELAISDHLAFLFERDPIGALFGPEIQDFVEGDEVVVRFLGHGVLPPLHFARG